MKSNSWVLRSALQHAMAEGWSIASFDPSSILLKHVGGNTVRYHLV